MKDKNTLLILGIGALVLIVISLGPRFGLFGVFPSFDETYSVEWEYDDNTGQFGTFNEGGLHYIGYPGYNDLSGNQWRIIRQYAVFLAGNSQVGDYSPASSINLDLFIVSKKLECGSGRINIIRFNPPDGSGLDLTPDTQSKIAEMFNTLDYETAESYGTYTLSSGDESVGAYINIPLNQQALEDFKQLNQQSTAKWVLGIVVEEPTNIPSQCDQYINTGTFKLDITAIENNPPTFDSITLNKDSAVQGESIIATINNPADPDGTPSNPDGTIVLICCNGATCTPGYSLDEDFCLEEDFLPPYVDVSCTGTATGSGTQTVRCTLYDYDKYSTIKSDTYTIGTAICNTPADTNCDSSVSDLEVLNYISKWINNQISDIEVLGGIQAWINS